MELKTTWKSLCFVVIFLAVICRGDTSESQGTSHDSLVVVRCYVFKTKYFNFPEESVNGNEISVGDDQHYSILTEFFFKLYANFMVQCEASKT